MIAPWRRRPEPGLKGSSRQPLPKGFGTLWTTVAVDLVGFGIMAPILPLYAERYRASPATIGVLMATFSLAQLLLAPFWGRLSDRVGRKPVILVSLSGTAVASLVLGLAGTLWVLFVARALDGASGASVSVAQASVLDVAHPKERARLIGLLGAAFGVGFVAGPALASLSALGGPRLPFLVAAAIAGANAIRAHYRLPETHPRSARMSSGSEVAAKGDVGVEGDLRPSWRLQGLGGFVLVAFLSMVAFSAFEATFALMGQRRLGFGFASTGAVFTVVGVLVALVQVGLVGPVVARFGDSVTLRIGLVIEAAGLALLAGVHSLLTLAPVLVVLTVGQGLVAPTVTALIAAQVRAGRRGGVLGVQQAAGGLARVIGPAMGGAAFGSLGVSAPYIIGASIVAVAAIGATSLRAAPSVRASGEAGILLVTDQ